MHGLLIPAKVLTYRSFAVVIWEILTRSDPFPEFTNIEAARQISKEGLHPIPPQEDEFALIMKVTTVKFSH